MDELTQPQKQEGFITLEAVLAMAIIAMTLGGVLLLSFSNQSVLTDGETNRELLTRAEDMLEKSGAIARKDFRLVVPAASTTDGIYEEALYVSDVDYFRKIVTASVSKTDPYGRNRSTALSLLLTDFENDTSGDTCDANLSGDWTAPAVKNTTTDFGTLIGDSAATYTLSGVDAYQGKLYVSAGAVSAANKETFFVFDISDPASPALLGKMDNAPTTSAGFAKIAATKDSSGSYVYGANSYGPNFSTCKTGPNCAQLQVVNVADPAHPSIAANFELPTSTAPWVSGSGGQAAGNSIFYKNGYVYLGLTKTASGPEFDIIDVHDPSHPAWVGGYSVGNAVNAIFVNGQYAYLATANAEELLILDISDPAHPRLAGGFDAPDSVGSGKSLYLVGNTLYLGRTVTSSNPELDVLDNTSPATLLSALGTREISSSVNGLFVRGGLAFLLTTSSQFQVFDVSDPKNIRPYASSLPLSATGGSSVPSLDCEGNYFFATSNDSGNKGNLYAITAKQ
jgi:hypothetical protein